MRLAILPSKGILLSARSPGVLIHIICSIFRISDIWHNGELRLIENMGRIIAGNELRDGFADGGAVPRIQRADELFC